MALYRSANKKMVTILSEFTDLSANTVTGVIPEMGRAPAQVKAPISDVAVAAKVAAAEIVAHSHPAVNALGADAATYLNAVYYNSAYPNGIAFFSNRSQQGEEAIVAVDLGKMTVVEKFTGRVEG